MGLQELFRRCDWSGGGMVTASLWGPVVLVQVRICERGMPRQDGCSNGHKTPLTVRHSNELSLNK